MPRIDPVQLLSCLRVLLSSTGGIINKDEVIRVANLMTKFSKKLVSKCIYVSILKSTEIDILDMFMTAGGWDLVFSWLSDGINAQNWAFVEELVELLLICPVNINRLKGNNCPKVIKLLSKNSIATERVRELAAVVVERWLTMVKEATCGRIQEQQQPELQPPPVSVESDPTSVPEEEPPPQEIIKPTSEVYKITIRDGPQVLAHVISDKSGPRVNTPLVNDEDEPPPSVESPCHKRLASSSEDGLDEDLEISPRKKVHTALPDSSDLSETSDEEWNKKKKKPLGRKRTSTKLVGESKSPAPKKRRQKVTKVIDKPLKSKLKEEKTVELIHPPSSKPIKKVIIKPPIKPDNDEKVKSVTLKIKEESSSDNKDQLDKDRDTLAKLITPSISSMGRIPKKPKESESDPKKTDKKEEKKSFKKVEPPKPPPKPAPKNPSKYNYTTSIGKREITEKVKTDVKTFNAKFRSTGLEEPPPLPKAGKKLDKKEDFKEKSPKRGSPPPAYAPLSKKHDLISKPVKEEEKTIEKTPPKPKKMHLQECDMFGNALTAANSFKDVRKKKRRPSVTDIKKEPDSPTKTTSDPLKDVKTERKAELVKPKLKFYQDTLLSDEEKMDAIKEEEDESEVSQKEIEDEMTKTEEAISNFVKQEEKRNVEREKCRLPRGILVYYKNKKIIKKSVTWKREDELLEIRNFEHDETERVNVTKNFMDMKQLEKANEREHFLLSRKVAPHDVMEERTHWRPLKPMVIQTQEFVIEPGKNSLEKDIQFRRELTVVPALYFHKKMIPDSPSEPDLEINAYVEPVIIPLTDQTGNPESVISYKETGWPEPKEAPDVSQPLLETPIIMHPPGAPPGGMPPRHMLQQPQPPPPQGPGLMPMMPGAPVVGGAGGGPPFPPGQPQPGFFLPPGPPMHPMIPPHGWMPNGDGQPGPPPPPFNPPQDMMMNQMGGPPPGMVDSMPFQPNMNPNMNMGGGNMGPGPNINQGFMGGPQGPPMNFPQQNQFGDNMGGGGPRPRSWYRHNAPNQWRPQPKGGGGPWTGKKNRNCINVIKKGYCNTPHCPFRHPPS